MTPIQTFAHHIAGKVMSAEVLSQRALGADWLTAYTEAWKTYDDTLELVYSDDGYRLAVHLEARIITGKELPL